MDAETVAVIVVLSTYSLAVSIGVLVTVWLWFRKRRRIMNLVVPSSPPPQPQQQQQRHETKADETVNVVVVNTLPTDDSAEFRSVISDSSSGDNATIYKDVIVFTPGVKVKHQFRQTGLKTSAAAAESSNNNNNGRDEVDLGSEEEEEETSVEVEDGHQNSHEDFLSISNQSFEFRTDLSNGKTTTLTPDTSNGLGNDNSIPKHQELKCFSTGEEESETTGATSPPAVRSSAVKAETVDDNGERLAQPRSEFYISVEPVNLETDPSSKENADQHCSDSWNEELKSQQEAEKLALPPQTNPLPGPFTSRRKQPIFRSIDDNLLQSINTNYKPVFDFVKIDSATQTKVAE